MTGEPATIVMLVGLKGAGKTTLGDRLARDLAVAFLRVEPVYLDVVRAHPGVAPADLEPVGFGAILAAIHELAASSPVVCIESTGTAGYFAEFLARLRDRYRVRLVRVMAAPDLCLERVLARDGANHIPVSDDRLREINRVAETVSLPWDLEVANADEADQRAAVAAIARLLHAARTEETT